MQTRLIALLLLIMLTACGDTNITNTNQNSLTAEMREACGDCKEEQELCPQCFNEEFLAEELSVLTCLEVLECV